MVRPRKEQPSNHSKLETKTKNPRYVPKAKKTPRRIKYQGADNLPVMPVVIIETWEQEQEIYHSNQDKGEVIRITYGVTNKKCGGTPRHPISKTEFIKLCQFLPRVPDLLSWFKVDQDALENWAARAFADHNFKSLGNLVAQLGSNFTFGLRRVMWDHAQRSPNAAVFLAKNYLGLRDAPNDEASALSVETINYNFVNNKALSEKRWNKEKNQIIEHDVSDKMNLPVNSSDPSPSQIVAEILPR